MGDRREADIEFRQRPAHARPAQPRLQVSPTTP
jgi:hypothetical protein